MVTYGSGWMQPDSRGPYLTVEKGLSASLLRKSQPFTHDSIRFSPDFFLRLANKPF
jgi:hypothetical protein